jgi:hypothetical protein
LIQKSYNPNTNIINNINNNDEETLYYQCMFNNNNNVSMLTYVHKRTLFGDGIYMSLKYSMV